MVIVNGIAIRFYISECYALTTLQSLQHLPLLSISLVLLVELQCWDKIATPSHVA